MQTPAQSAVDLDKMTNQLALELASKLQPPAKILVKYGLTDAQFNRLAATPQFQQLFREARQYWESDKNAAERVRAKCTMLVEDSLLEVFKMVHDEGLAPASRLDGFRTLAKMAGVSGDGRGDGSALGERFSITINLDKDRAVTIDGATGKPEEDDV